jgi:Na+/serine symporter
LILLGCNAFQLPHDIASQSDGQGFIIGLEKSWL